MILRSINELHSIQFEPPSDDSFDRQKIVQYRTTVRMWQERKSRPATIGAFYPFCDSLADSCGRSDLKGRGETGDFDENTSLGSAIPSRRRNSH